MKFYDRHVEGGNFLGQINLYDFPFLKHDSSTSYKFVNFL